MSIEPSATPRVSVIVPVYNGYDAVVRLSATLFAHTDRRHDIVFIDDASTDRRIAPLLAGFAEANPNVRVVRNKVNLGFSHNVNLGASLSERDFVMLNSDTEVPPGWIPRLFHPIWSVGDTASATPFASWSKSHGFMADPAVGRALCERYGIEALDRVLAQLPADPKENAIVRGHGFCMAISRKAWNAVGPFNEELFGRGYGEETDWCLRAHERGFVNRLVPNLLVGHWHNGSFDAEETRRLIAEHRRTIRRLHPDAPKTKCRDMPAFIAARARICEALRQAGMTPDAPLPNEKPKKPNMTALARFWNFLSAQGACEKRVFSFDALRAAAFVCVLIQHSYGCLIREFGLKEWMHGHMLGRLGVSFFIILSGASLALGSLKSGYFAFLRKRAASILPFYWVAYVVVGVFLFLLFGRICMRGDIPKILMTVFAMDGHIPIKGRYYLIGEWFTGFMLIMYLLAPMVHWSIRRTRGLILPLYFVISVLAIKYTPVLSQSIAIWHSHANFNVLSRIFEFALGIFFSLYVLRRRRLHALLAAAGGAYIIGFIALGHDVFEFTATGFLSLFCIFLVLTYLLPFVPFAESQRSIISFFAKYSFMAFLFHHQVLLAMKAKMALKCAPEYVVYMAVSSFLLSYLLAYVFYRPAECLKRAVFGPYHEH